MGVLCGKVPYKYLSITKPETTKTLQKCHDLPSKKRIKRAAAHPPPGGSNIIIESDPPKYNSQLSPIPNYQLPITNYQFLCRACRLAPACSSRIPHTASSGIAGRHERCRSIQSMLAYNQTPNPLYVREPGQGKNCLTSIGDPQLPSGIFILKNKCE